LGVQHLAPRAARWPKPTRRLPLEALALLKPELPGVRLARLRETMLPKVRPPGEKAQLEPLKTRLLKALKSPAWRLEVLPAAAQPWLDGSHRPAARSQVAPEPVAPGALLDGAPAVVSQIPCAE
jgi:hypothetical protein